MHKDGIISVLTSLIQEETTKRMYSMKKHNSNSPILNNSLTDKLLNLCTSQ